MRSSHSMTYNCCLVPAAILCGMAASVAWAQTKYEPVTREVLDEVTLAAKQTPQYQWYSALPGEQMEELVTKWQEEFGLRLNPQCRPMWELIWGPSIDLPGGGSGLLRMTGAQGRNTLILETTRYQTAGASVPNRIINMYVIRDADLGSLGDRVLVSVAVRDPLTAPVERFAAQNEPLSTLFSRLCTMGQASCSYRQDLADKMRITLDLRGKTVLGCLTVLARTAGGQAMVLPSGYVEPVSVEKVGLDKFVNLDNLRKGQAEGPSTQPAASQPDPVELLRKAVQEDVEKLRKDRPVIILQLPAASE